MLSFMREQGGQTQDHKPKTTDTKPESGVLDREYFTVATQNKNVRKTTYLLAVLFGCGLLFLWFMIKKSTPLSAVADSQGGTEQEQIEMAIAQLTGVRLEMTGQMDEVVKKFYQFSDVQQVNVDELVKNPFGPVGVVREPPLLSSMGENRESRIEMQLLSIMRSDQGSCCMLRVRVPNAKGGKMGPFEDKILYEGDSIRGFKVRQIGDGFVKLEAENSEVILKLSE